MKKSFLALGISVLFSPLGKAGFFYQSSLKKAESFEKYEVLVPEKKDKVLSSGTVFKPQPFPSKKIKDSQKDASQFPSPILGKENPERFSSPPEKEKGIPLIPLPQEREIKPNLPQWSADRGSSLREVLERWAREADVDLEWGTEFDYPLLTSFSAQGTFEEVLRKLLDAFSESSPRPYGRLHKNGSHRVLIIQTRGKNHYDH